MLEAGKRGLALKNRLVGDAEMHKELLNRESRRAEDGVKYFKDTSKERKRQEDRQVFTAPSRCLDGIVADNLRHERTVDHP